MLISLCTPVMNRTRDLKYVMPYRLEAARLSPPVEIVIVDYNSQDDLGEYITSIDDYEPLIYRKYTKRDTFHMAHAFNLALMAGSGEYVVSLGADAMIARDFVQHLRTMIADGCLWIKNRNHTAMVAIKKSEFIAAGGFDERFELYGPEELELDIRLSRRNLKYGYLPARMIQYLYTPDDMKIANYRVHHNRSSMSRIMRPFYQDSMENHILVANEGKEWGQWV